MKAAVSLHRFATVPFRLKNIGNPPTCVLLDCGATLLQEHDLNLDHDHPNILTNMSETLLSILCGEDLWRWDASNDNTITFNQDGTGEVSPVCVRRRGHVAQPTRS